MLPAFFYYCTLDVCRVKVNSTIQVSSTEEYVPFTKAQDRCFSCYDLMIARKIIFWRTSDIICPNERKNYVRSPFVIYLTMSGVFGWGCTHTLQHSTGIWVITVLTVRYLKPRVGISRVMLILFGEHRIQFMPKEKICKKYVRFPFVSCVHFMVICPQLKFGKDWTNFPSKLAHNSKVKFFPTKKIERSRSVKPTKIKK